MKYKPWGTLEFALSLSNPKQWGFIGTIGTEDRALCAWHEMKCKGIINKELFIKVNAIKSSKYFGETKRKLQERTDEFALKGGDQSVINEYELMSELYLIQPFLQMSSKLSESIVLDISSMPKRFYFLILKELVNNLKIKNLLVIYTSPESYTSEPLYEDIDVWRNLPGFGGGYSTKKENLIVSIGFLVESLNNYLSNSIELSKVSVLFPFPSPLSVQRRTWESVVNLESDKDKTYFKRRRLDTLDLSTAFDYIKSISDSSDLNSVFAPFGPKTFSVAMCLYAIQNDSAVYYPQPTVYHPEYTLGIKNNSASEAVNAYWVKHDGKNFYE